MKKKLFSIIMCALMVMCLMPSMAFAESGATEVADLSTLKTELAKESPVSVKLTSDIENINEIITIDGGKSVTIDLNGHTISFAEEKFFYLKNGTLEFKGEGTVKEVTPKYAPVIVAGSKTSTEADYSTLIVGKNVTLSGWDGIQIDYAGKSEEGNNHAYGVVVTVNGTLKANYDGDQAGSGIWINGDIKDTEGYVPKITLSDTSKIVASGQTGIYAAGYAEWTLEGDITAGQAVTAKSGKITINKGTYISEGDGTKASAYDIPRDYATGSAYTGAAVGITSNDNYAKKLDLVINDGTFKSAYDWAVYEGIGQYENGNMAATSSYATVAINGGDFEGYTELDKKGDAVRVTNAAEKKVITGGTFNADPTKYVAEGYQAVENKDGTWSIEPKTLTSIAITVKEPEVGKTPDYDYTWTVKSKDSGNSQTAIWLKIAKDKYDEDSFEDWEVVGEKEKFQKDYYYMFVTGFKPNDGYTIGDDDPTATVNGKEAIVSVVDKSVAYVIKIYGPLTEKSPATGDNSELGIFAVAGLISAVGVALVLRRKQSN